MKLKDIVSKTDTDGVRVYSHFNGKTETTGHSVTTIVSRFEDKSFLKFWRKEVGEEKAKEITRNAAAIGTRVHTANEYYLIKPEKYSDYLQKMPDDAKERHLSFMPFLQQVTALSYLDQPLIEQKLLCEIPIEGKQYGFGGTADLVGGMSKDRFHDLFFANRTCKKRINPEEITFGSDPNNLWFVGDYKNWRKNGKSQSELVKYYLQLSAYMILVNQFIEEPYKIRNGFLLGSTDKGLSVYYLSFREMCWYATYFLEMVRCFYENEYFDWTSFVDFSLRKEDQHYKSRRLYIKGGESNVSEPLGLLRESGNS